MPTEKAIGGGVKLKPVGFVAQDIHPQRAPQDTAVSSAQPGGYGFSQKFTSSYFGDPAAAKSVVLSEQFNTPPPRSP